MASKSARMRWSVNPSDNVAAAGSHMETIQIQSFLVPLFCIWYISACIRAVASFPSVSLRIINHTRMLRSILEDTAHGVVLSYPHSRVPHSPIHIRWLYAFYAFIFPVQDIFSHPPGRKSGRGVPVPRQKNIECAILV